MSKGKRYTHDFDIMFAVESDLKDGEDVSCEDLRAGLLKRIETLNLDDYKEATGCVTTIDNNE